MPAFHTRRLLWPQCLRPRAEGHGARDLTSKRSDVGAGRGGLRPGGRRGSPQLPRPHPALRDPQPGTWGCRTCPDRARLASTEMQASEQPGCWRTEAAAHQLTCAGAEQPPGGGSCQRHTPQPGPPLWSRLQAPSRPRPELTTPLTSSPSPGVRAAGSARVPPRWQEGPLWPS